MPLELGLFNLASAGNDQRCLPRACSYKEKIINYDYNFLLLLKTNVLLTPFAKESGKFCLWNLKSWALESVI